jgi:hypothetical protein
MQLRLLVQVFLQRSLLLVFCIALNSCQLHKANSGPSIEFTHIPPAAQGGRERVDTISGRVRNAGLERTTLLAKMKRLGISRPVAQGSIDVLGMEPDNREEAQL